jgi:sec-independent protein translocase protein TatB
MNGFFGIGFMELAFIAILALIVLGPERLPGAARETAKFLGQLRAISSEFTSQFSEELQMLDELNPKKLADEFVQDAMKPASKQGADKSKKTPTKPKPTPNAQPLAEKNTAPKPAETKSQTEAEVEEEVGLDSAEENQILPPASIEAGDAAANGSRTAPPTAAASAEEDVTVSTDADGADSDSAEKPA